MTLPRKLLLLTSLYLSQGLPYGFFTQALPVLLRTQGASLPQIGLSNLLALPWALKFLLAPWVDRRAVSPRGKHRSLIIPLQLLAALTLLAVAPFPASTTMAPLLVVVLLVNLLAATQDIATDSLAVQLLDERERGLGNGIQVGGYRLGMIVGGGVLLIAMDRLGWSGTFVAMSALLCLATAPIVLFDETAEHQKHLETKPTQEPSEPLSYASELLAWLRSTPRRNWLVLLVVYKTGEALASGMLRPFLVDTGMSLADIGALLGTLGFTLGLVGAVAGGALVQRMGRKASLVVFGALQSLAILSLAVVASRGVAIEIASVCAFEHLTSGMATAALFTAMMDASRPERSATDYTLQACAVVIATGGAAAASGALAKQVGYPTHFAIAAVVSFAGALFALRASALHPTPAVAELSFPQRACSGLHRALDARTVTR